MPHIDGSDSPACGGEMVGWKYNEPEADEALVTGEAVGWSNAIGVAMIAGAELVMPT